MLQLPQNAVHRPAVDQNFVYQHHGGEVPLLQVIIGDLLPHVDQVEVRDEAALLQIRQGVQLLGAQAPGPLLRGEASMV